MTSMSKVMPKFVIPIMLEKVATPQNDKYHKLWMKLFHMYMAGYTNEDVALHFGVNEMAILWVKRQMLGGKTVRGILWNRKMQDLLDAKDTLYFESYSLLRFNRSGQNKEYWAITKRGRRAKDFFGKGYYFTDREKAVSKFVEMFPAAHTPKQMINRVRTVFLKNKASFIRMLRSNF